MSADSIIRADASAYPEPMKRLIVLLGLAAGLAAYRHRVLDRREQDLAIGPYAGDGAR